MFGWLRALLGIEKTKAGKAVPVEELPEAVNDVLDTEMQATVFSPLETGVPEPAKKE